MKHFITIKKKFNTYGKLVERQIIIHYMTRRLESDPNEKKASKAEKRQEDF